jgi:GT2 family glycosyltransferase
VLVVLVARDGAEWLPQCLLALSRQTHPRIGVLAIDNASSDQSGELLESALGADRVLQLEHNVGFAGAVTRALGSPMAQQADYLLLLHDDTVLAPDAVAALVEAAERFDAVGVVGPKILDWEQQLVLVDIGQSTDRFGFPYSPLEDGEIDQGQYDRIREVVFVSSCAMLVSRPLLQRIGGPDERFSLRQEDLDLCWRARLAGYRVLMTPKAIARHRSATMAGVRPSEEPPRPLYERERAALGSVLKNYGLLSLLWVLPLYAIQGLGRLLAYLLTRRFEDAYQLLAGWGWNLVHLPGTLRRRFRVQSMRTVPDQVVRRSMAPAWIRFRRWAGTALPRMGGGIGHIEEDEESVEARPRSSIWRLAAAHPVATAFLLLVPLALVAYRDLAFASPLTGGAVATSPSSASGFFGEFVSGLRSTGLGGTGAASPSLALMGLGSVLALGSPALLEKVLLMVLPIAAGIGAYRAVKAITGEIIPSVVAAGCYGLSSVVLWGLSEGRVPVLVLLGGLPWMANKIPLAFESARPVTRRRWIVGAALGAAVLAAFYPGALVAALLLSLCALVIPDDPRERLRGLGLVVLSAAAGALLLFPVAYEWIRAGGVALADPAGSPSFAALARLSLGAAPGSWVTGFYLPVAAAIGYVFVPGHLDRTARRAALAAIIALYLAWLASAGYLPEALSNTVAYLAVLAFSYCLLVGMGLVFLVRGAREADFGARQVGAVLMAGVVAVGLGAQVLQAAQGAWAIGGPERAPAAYPVVTRSASEGFRVLWVGELNGDPLIWPGGLPVGTVEAGPASIRYTVQFPSGASMLDFGRPAAGVGYEALQQALADMLSGESRHGGALLAPFGIRYVVAEPGDLPMAALRRLSRQVDLDLVPSQGLIILRNAKAPPPASAITDRTWISASSVGGTDAALASPDAIPFEGGPQEYRGTLPTNPSLVLLTQQYDGTWRLEAGGAEPRGPDRAFGWAVGFDGPRGPSEAVVAFGGQQIRTVETGVLAVMWFLALWMTRRTARNV